MTKSVTDDMKVLALFFLLLLPNLAFSAALVEPTAIDKQVVQLTDEETAWLKSNPELGHLALKIRSRVRMSEPEHAWTAGKPRVPVRVGDYPPFFFTDDNKPQGLAIDYVKIMCFAFDLECDYVTGMPITESFTSMREPGGIAVQPAWQRNPSREELATFTKPYFFSPFVIFQRKGDALINGMDELTGKRVVVERNYAIHKLLQRDYPDLQLVEVDFSSEALELLAAGGADAYVGNLMVGNYLSVTLGMSNIVVAAQAPYDANAMSIAVRKDRPELASLFNKGINALRPDEHAVIKGKWTFGFDSRLQESKRLISLSSEERMWLDAHFMIPLCVDPNWVPFEQINQKGEYEGMVADYMALISERLGVPFKLLPTKDFSESLKKVSTGECQILSSWASVSDIEDPGLLTSSYMTASAVLAVHQDVPYILVHQDLAGLRVGAVANYPTQGKVKRLYPEAELVLVDNVDQGLQMVAAGELDAFMATQTAIVYSIQRQRLTQVKIGGVVPGEEHIGMVVNRQQPILLSILNKAVASIESDDRRRITNKWLTVTVEREFDYSLLWKVVSGFLLILAAVLAWNYVIRRQKQALVASQARLSESEQRFRELFVYSPVAFQSLNSEGRFVDVNKPLCDLLGYDKESLLGHEFGEFWSPAIRSAYSKAFSNFKSCGETAGDLELIRSDGSIVYVHLIGRIQYDDEGRMVRTHCALHDISDRRRYEEELTKARETAEASNQAKSMFLANMSHELRTPLNAILGFSQMLGSDQSASEDQQQKLTIINRSGEHLLGMINDILDLSKIEAGEVELEQTAFNLPQVLQELGEMFEMRARSRGLLFELELNRNLASCIKADSGKLRQILINLLGNAAKFTREGGFTLRAKTTAIADDSTMVILHIEVDDSGPGIAPDQLDRIFKPFVRAEGSSASVKGTGLGLAITKSFVGLMGGEISVESTPGVGSIFRVELPVALAEAAEMAAVEIARPTVLGLEPDQPEWRILVVEDNPENRQLLVSMLHQAGFKVQEAENGKEGVSVFTQWQPHFIWMDMRMPVMDGYEATAEIRKLPSGDKVKIVAITASAFHEQHQKILDAGCDEVVHKPFKVHEVFDSMQQHLGVRYIHETEKAEPAIKLTSEMLAKLPVEQREALRQAAHDLGISATDQVIETIRSEHPEIADALQLMANAYQFGKILALLEKEESE